MRRVVLSGLLLLGCGGDLPTYSCGEPAAPITCRVDEACVRHYSASSGWADEHECSPDRDCGATSLGDYCRGDAVGTRCAQGPAPASDETIASVTIVSCSYR